MRVHLTFRLKIGEKVVKRSGIFKINPDLFIVSPDRQVVTIAKGWLKSIRIETDKPVVLIKAIYNGNHEITNLMRERN